MLKVFLVLTAFSVAKTTAATSWYMDFLKSGQLTLVDCRRKTGAFDSFDEDYHVSLVRMKDCVKDVFLNSLDNLIETPDIQLNPYVSMKMESNFIDSNLTEPIDSREELFSEDLTTSVTKRVFRLFDTHAFKVNLQAMSQKDGGEVEEGRRRHYRKAFPMMVVGYMMISAFMVPFGFQYLAMLIGKALLLAKIAFFLSMYSGYTRVSDHLEYHHHHPHSGGGHNSLSHHLAYHHRRADNLPSNSPYSNKKFTYEEVDLTAKIM